MLTLLFAAILAGGALATIEFIVIILTCGPFWISPTIYFKTLVIYAVVILIGSLLVNQLICIITPRNKFTTKPIRQFYLHLILFWLLGSICIAGLIYKDMETGTNLRNFSVIALIIGSFSILTFWVISKRWSVISGAAILALLVLIITTSGTYLISNWHFTSIINQRSIEYQGTIPNLCLIVLDTARGDHFSCYGYPFETTPNFDQVAKEGLLASNAYSASNWTPPGHICIFTGKYPSQHANDGQPFMPDTLLSLSEILNQKGYYGIAFYNNKIAGKSANITQGFDRDTGVYINSWVYPSWKRLYDKFVYNDDGARSTFSMALETFKWFSQRGGHLFLYINIFEPHMEYLIHEPFFSEITESLIIDEIPNLVQVQRLCNNRRKVGYDSTYFAAFNDQSYQYLRAVYDSEIAYVDQQFGFFSQGMRASGLLDYTLLIVTSDHGEFLGEHFTAGHPSILFNQVLRIPFIIRYPDSIQPSIIEDYVSNVDVFPTALNIMGYEDCITDDVAGVDVLNCTELRERRILSEYLRPITEKMTSLGYRGCLFSGPYKIMLNDDPWFIDSFPADTLLFDLNQDPEELFSISTDKRVVTDSLVADLCRWVTKIKVSAEEKIELSDEAIRNLKALGYIQ